MTIKRRLSIIAFLFMFVFISNGLANVAVDSPCIGNNYEQSSPVKNIVHPTVSITASAVAVPGGEVIWLTADATVDQANGGVADFFWCAEDGLLEYDPDYPDYSTVRFIAPQVTGDADIRVAVQAGDNLGYVAVASIMIPVKDFSVDDDQDGLPDAWEKYYFNDDLTQTPEGDYDGDGMSNGWEYQYSLNPAFDDSAEDPDNDGFTNGEEYLLGTDPYTPNVCETDYNVPGEYATIQEAIFAANNNGGGYVRVQEGVYNENIELLDCVFVIAQGDPQATIIQGDGKRNVVEVNGNKICGLVGFTIQGSKLKGNAGGVVFNGNNEPLLARCIIKANNHGIVINGNGDRIIANNVITENAGDGIHANGNGPALIHNNIIVSNDGKGIYCNGQASMDIAYNAIHANAGDDAKKAKACAEGIETLTDDPLFIGMEDYHLADYSPCIDAGNPELQDEDGSRSDIGVYGGPWRREYLSCGASPCEVNDTNAGAVTVVPSAETVKPGDKFKVQVRINGENIWAAHVDVKVAPDTLKQVGKGSYGSFFKLNKSFKIPIRYDAAVGSWSGALSLKHPAAPVSGEGIFAKKLKYKALAGKYGATPITVTATLTDKDGNALPSQTVNGEIFIDDGIHGGNVVIQGTVNHTDGTPAANVPVTISVNGNEYTVITDENGHYQFDDLQELDAGESYDIEASLDGFEVEAEVTAEDINNSSGSNGNDPPTVDVPMQLLNTKLADLNQDGKINIADFTLLANAYGTAAGQSGFDERADINKDGKVNIADLAMLGSYWKI